MSAGARVGAFVALLAAIFAAAGLAGSAIDPTGRGDGARGAGTHMDAHGVAGDRGAEP